MLNHRHICLFIVAFIVEYSVGLSCLGTFDPSKVTLRLFNQDYPSGTTSVTSANLIPGSEIKVIIHGWSENGTNYWLPELASGYISRSPDVNVITVDYGPYSETDYLTAYCLTDKVGNNVGQRLQELGVDGRFYLCAGFSLGAHICGYASSYFSSNDGNKWKLIIGMDAASPGFHTFPFGQDNLRKPLGRGNATLVIGYYTNGCSLGYGTNPDVEYADHNVIVEDGCCQDGCAPCSVAPPNSSAEIKKRAFCSHIFARAVEIKQQTSDAYNVVRCETLEKCKKGEGSGIGISLSVLWTSTAQSPPKNYFLVPNTS